MCLGALRGEHSLKVARRARAGQTFPPTGLPCGFRGASDTASTSSHGSGDLDMQSGSDGEELCSTDVSDTRRPTVCDNDSVGHNADSSGTSLLWGVDSECGGFSTPPPLYKLR